MGDNTRKSRNQINEDWDVDIEAEEKRRQETILQEKEPYPVNQPAESDWAIEVEKQDTQVYKNRGIDSQNHGNSSTHSWELDTQLDRQSLEVDIGISDSSASVTMQRWPSQELDVVMPTFSEQNSEPDASQVSVGTAGEQQPTSKGASQSDPSRDIEKIIDRASEFTISKEKKAPQAPDISWTEVNRAHLGQFFVNKVYLSQHSNRVWTPTDLGVHTKCLDFEEVAMCSENVEEADNR